MFAVGILFALLVYILTSLGVIALVRRIMPTRSAKNWASVVVTLVAVLIPTGDHIIGYWVFKRECSKIGDGVEIVRTVENVEGFLDMTGRWTDAAKFHGYTYVEVPASRGTFLLIRETPGGTWEQKAISTASSKYVYESTGTMKLKWGISQETHTVADRLSGERLARAVALGYGGGTVASYLGGGDYGQCGWSPRESTAFVKIVLQPVRNVIN